MTTDCNESAMARCYAAGDAVEVCDHSEAHGDKGKVLWTQKDGLIIVELESGCCWPVTAEELTPLNDRISDPATPNHDPLQRQSRAGFGAAHGWACGRTEQKI